MNQLKLSQNDCEEPNEVSLLTKWEDATITRKQWIYKNNKVFTQDNKEFIPKRELFQVLSHAHRWIAHRGRQITTKWLRENYAEVNQKVINIFVKMCKFHAEQKSVTSNVKLVKQPMQAPTFLHMIEIDLMDYRKCPCECIEPHTWAMNITDHHTKHVTLYPLTAKWVQEIKIVQQSEKKSAKKCNQFKVGDVVSIKIDRVDKTSLFHPNMLLGKITELENQFARVVTKFGRIQTLISPTRINLCTATNLSFDYTKEITFTSACKQASIQNA